MTKAKASELISLGNRLFSKKYQLDNLFQEIAWQFTPDLADFVDPIQLGEDWAADRMDGYPEMVSRELSSQMSAMLRPQDRPWFRTTTLDEMMDADENNARALQYVTSVVKKGLYDPKSKFVRATKEADRFYVNFGQAVISIEESPKTRDHLFFRNHHIKSCAWLENELGDIDHLHRKEKMTARTMVLRFNPNKLHPAVKRAAEKEPFREFEVREIVMPSGEYNDASGDGSGNSNFDRRRNKLPFTRCYIDVENETIIKEDGLPEFIYVVPRWFRFVNSQYAFSPATMSGLADARMAQMLAQIILEAGEKAVDPPLIGKQEIVIGEPNIMAGGISWVDAEYDSSLKDALDVIKVDADLRVGFEMRNDIRTMLTKAFYIDKFSLPEPGKNMTAYEVSQRLEEHVRNLLPLFEPMQIEYNTKVLDLSFSLLRNMRKFDWELIPDDLSGADFTWAFESPIQRAQDAIMVEQFKASLEIMMMGMQAGATTKPLDVNTSMRDAIRGVGGPATWRPTIEEQEAEVAQAEQEQQMLQAMQQLQQGAEVASQVGDAANKLGLQPPADKVLAAQAKAGGGQGGAGAMPVEGAQPGGEPMPTQEEPLPWEEMAAAAGGQEVMPSQPADMQMMQRQPMTIEDIMQSQERILMQLASLEQAITKPKKISIKRGKDGKIESATAGTES